MAERGQAILEFAMIVPMLFLMLVGVAFFAMGFNLQQVLHGAAYEGARGWAKNPVLGNVRECSPPKCDPDSTDASENNFEKYIKPVVRNYVSSQGFDGSKVVFQNQASLDSLVTSEYVTVTILYPYNLPIGNFASSYLEVKVSAKCTLKKG
jgi:hypothetical protein